MNPPTIRPTLEAGLLRQRVQVQQKVISGTGDRGQPVYTWATFATVYAGIESITPFGAKGERARQLMTTATHEVMMRYLPGLTEQCRLLWGTRVFQIGYIWNHQERNAWLTLLAMEQKTGQK